MPGARTVGHPEIGRDSDQSDVDVVECSRKRGAHEGRDLGKARLRHRVVRLAVAEGRSLVVLDAHGEYASRFGPIVVLLLRGCTGIKFGTQIDASNRILTSSQIHTANRQGTYEPHSLRTVSDCLS